MNNLYRSLLIGVIAVSSCVFDASAQDSIPYEQKKDLVFGEVHGTGLLMDVFVPKGASNGLAIVDIASGAWNSDRSKIRDHTLAQIYPIFCTRGYTVFAIRPGSKTRYTVAEMDRHVKLGIRYIKEHATEYGIDPERLGITGASAGGHLATLAALTPLAGKPDSDKASQRLSTSVKAVGVFFPPTDLVEWDTDKKPDPEIVGPLLFLNGSKGHTEEEILAKSREASPLYRVGTPTIPFLLIHGDSDSTVPISHSQKLVDAIKKVGGSAELIIKKGGGHAWITLPEEVRTLADWFDAKLGATPINVETKKTP